MVSAEYYALHKDRILARARERYEPNVRKARYMRNREEILAREKVKRHFKREQRRALEESQEETEITQITQ